MNIKHHLQIIKLSKKYFSNWFFIPFVIPFSNIHTEKKNADLKGFALYGKEKLHYIAIDSKNTEIGLDTKIMNKIKSKITYLRVHPDNKNAIKFFAKHGFNKAEHINALLGPRIIMRKK